MKKQVVVRTYPNNYIPTTTQRLERYLSEGYIVVMCNQFHCDGKFGNEYILEKEVEE